MSDRNELIYLLATDKDNIPVVDWETARLYFVKKNSCWNVRICELNEATKTYDPICDISKKYARFGGIDCVLIQRMTGKRKYKEHQLCETLNEVPVDIRPYLYKLR